MDACSLKLLVVDDDDVDREHIRRMLNTAELNASIEETESVGDSIAVIKEYNYDCVIIDYRLGTEDGLSLLNEIRNKLSKNCAVIMVTGLGDEEVAAEAMRLGASDYLIKKNLKPTLLLSAILNAVHKAELEKKIRDLAHYDDLTGLVSRHLLLDRLRHVIARITRQGKPSALAFLDLDDFKPVNDNHGHEAGDFVLVEIAKKLTNVIRAEDTVARIGGDEFVLLLKDIESASACEELLKRVLLVLEVPVQLPNECFIRVSASIGVTLINENILDADTVLRRADQTMYQAKSSECNKILFFDPAQEQKQIKRRQFMQEIENAIGNDEFTLFYQPKVDTISNKLIGVEALIRWQHPDRGLLSPYYFSEALEHTTIGIQIGEWVIHEALNQCSLWCNEGVNINVSINISAPHIQNSNFVDKLIEHLVEFPSVRPDLIELEVLESVSIKNVKYAVSVLDKCRKLGIKVALDDFGTGYASLSYLKKLPLDTLKIDKSFIQNLGIDETDEAIVKGIIELSKVFNYQLIAEGVENLQQLKKYQNLGGTCVQGYLIAKPMEGSKVISWLAAHNYTDKR